MDRNTMLFLLEQGKDPLALSILKWESILAKTVEDERSLDCALCYTYDDYNNCPFDDCCALLYSGWYEHQLKKT